jgi:hypothetical protein
MPVEQVIQILMALLQAAPDVVNLITAARATNGIVPAEQIAQIFNKYGIDRAVFVASIATAKAAGK